MVDLIKKGQIVTLEEIYAEIRLRQNFSKMEAIVTELFGTDRVASTRNLDIYVMSGESRMVFPISIDPKKNLIKVYHANALKMAKKLVRKYKKDLGEKLDYKLEPINLDI